MRLPRPAQRFVATSGAPPKARMAAIACVPLPNTVVPGPNMGFAEDPTGPIHMRLPRSVQRSVAP
eukprot:242447-Pyramimonas_sp.AAC.2